MELTYLKIEYEESFSQYYLEYANEKLNHNQLYLELYELGYSDYGKYMEKLQRQQYGNGLPEGWAPVHTLFLIDNNDINKNESCY